MQKTVTIELPETLLQPLAGLIDAGVRASGLRAVKDAALILDAIERSMAEHGPQAGRVPTPAGVNGHSDASGVSTNG